ncbi:MAG: ferredoxin [Candidatus Pacebacteria bacterium]|nr:ferredoxin [Candidatus Paceibacterota bacterium]
MPKITLDKTKCIGCGTCWSLCATVFEPGEEGKSHPKGAKKNNNIEEVEIEEVDCAKEAAEVCPVQCIKII